MCVIASQTVKHTTCSKKTFLPLPDCFVCTGGLCAQHSLGQSTILIIDGSQQILYNLAQWPSVWAISFGWQKKIFLQKWVILLWERPAAKFWWRNRAAFEFRKRNVVSFYFMANRMGTESWTGEDLNRCNPSWRTNLDPKFFFHHFVAALSTLAHGTVSCRMGCDVTLNHVLVGKNSESWRMWTLMELSICICWHQCNKMFHCQQFCHSKSVNSSQDLIPKKGERWAFCKGKKALTKSAMPLHHQWSFICAISQAATIWKCHCLDLSGAKAGPSMFAGKNFWTCIPFDIESKNNFVVDLNRAYQQVMLKAKKSLWLLVQFFLVFAANKECLRGMINVSGHCDKHHSSSNGFECMSTFGQAFVHHLQWTRKSHCHGKQICFTLQSFFVRCIYPHSKVICWVMWLEIEWVSREWMNGSKFKPVKPGTWLRWKVTAIRCAMWRPPTPSSLDGLGCVFKWWCLGLRSCATRVCCEQRWEWNLSFADGHKLLIAFSGSSET